MMAHEASPAWGQVVLDTTDVRGSAEFWRQLLGLVYRPGHEAPAEGDPDAAAADGWINLFAPDGTPRLAFQHVDDLARTTWPDHAVPQQLHLDLTVGDVRELESVHERVIALGGALRLDRSDDPVEPLRVFVDPAGHTFCVFVA
jgi:hypothetical protein